MLPEQVALMFDIASRDHLEEGGIEAIAAKLGRPLDNSRSVTVRDGVAVIPIEGAIFPRASLFTAISGGVSVDTLAADFSTALADPLVTGIVLLIDSPGGDKNGVPELAGMIHAARGKKPIVAYGRELVASAAYWIGSAADELVIASDALVGSIGVVAGVADPSKQGGRSIQFVSSRAPHKRTDPTTEAGRARYQARVDAVEDIFIADVARYRGVTPEKVMADFGQGDLLVGQAAVAAGMADRLGSFEGVVAELQQRAREPRRIGIAGRIAAQSNGGSMPDQKGRMERFMSWLAGEGDDSAFVGADSAASGIEGSGNRNIAPPATSSVAPGATHAATSPDPEVERLRAELARRDEAERARARADIGTRAQGFAEAEIRASRALPAERDALVAAFTDAATDDLDHPRAEGQPSRVDRLTERQAARPAHGLTAELVPVKPNEDGTLSVVANAARTKEAGAPPEFTPERYRDSLARTETGRGVLLRMGVNHVGPLSDGQRATLAARMAELAPAAHAAQAAQ
jgi:ClpP class serine protease